MIALVDLAVHDEVIQLGIFQHRLVVGGNNDRHVVDPHAFTALGADILLDKLLVDILGDGILRIIALGHDIGNRRHNGGKVLHSLSVRAHGSFLVSVV